MLILGIDHGLGGALSLVECAPLVRPRLIDVIDMPTVGEKAKRRPNVSGIVEWLNQHQIDRAFGERAQAYPKQGSSSGFIYGRAVGFVEATILCCGIRLHTAEPTMWKKFFGLLKSDKDRSVNVAKQHIDRADLFLTRKLDHNRAESMLIAVYGAAQLGIRTDENRSSEDWPAGTNAGIGHNSRSRSRSGSQDRRG